MNDAYNQRPLPLGQFLQAAGLASAEQIDQAVLAQVATGEPLAITLVRQGVLEARAAAAVTMVHEQLRTTLEWRAMGQVPPEGFGLSKCLRLGGLLLACGEVNHQNIDAALRRQASYPRKIGRLLIGLGAINEQQLAQILVLQKRIRQAVLTLSHEIVAALTPAERALIMGFADDFGVLPALADKDLHTLPHEKVLIVEDHEETRKMLRLSFETEHYRTIEATEGAGAIELAQAQQPDVMLLDVMMPGGLDGFAVCQAVRRDPTLSGMFIVILTALSGQDALSRGKNAGADYCLTKPFSPTKLLNLIGARPRNGLVAAM